jgi:hypothetical protein
MKKIFLYTVLAISFLGCSDYLDIVPENLVTYEDSFTNRSDATGVLHSLYSSIPNYGSYRSVIETTSDEFILPTGWGKTWFPLKRMWAGEVSTNNPIFTYWSSNGGGTKYDMYNAIRYCYMFLNNIDDVPGLSNKDLSEMKGQAIFLIAYYHFRLVSLYGPIVIVDREIDLNSSLEEINVPRNTYDESIDFVVSKFEEAAILLPSNVGNSDLGKPTSVVAKSLAARALLYAASPLFNGNSDFGFDSFKNPDGTHLINQTFDKDKWKKAMDANLDAINAAHSAGIQLYHSSITAENPFDQAILDNRYKIVDPWNQELIWGYGGKDVSFTENWQYVSSPNVQNGSGSNPYNAIAPTINVAQQYYTKNGLPISEDPAYDYTNRYTVKAGDSTAYFNRDREPRYYSSIAFDRGIYEFNDEDVVLKMRNGEINGKRGIDFSASGLLIKKLTHPATTVDTDGYNANFLRYPWPIIRLAELYLNYAEAYFEYNGQLSGQALIYFNEVRLRAGVPDLQTAWAGKNIDYKEVIRNERMVELMFEAHRYYDIRRWKEGTRYFKDGFSNGTQGFNVNGNTLEEYNTIQSSAEYDFQRVWFDNNYLHPLPLVDEVSNPNFVNNPGW